MYLNLKNSSPHLRFIGGCYSFWRRVIYHAIAPAFIFIYIGDANYSPVEAIIRAIFFCLITEVFSTKATLTCSSLRSCLGPKMQTRS